MIIWLKPIEFLIKPIEFLIIFNSYLVFNTVVFWIEEAQYIAEEKANLDVKIHRDGNLLGTDTLSE